MKKKYLATFASGTALIFLVSATPASTPAAEEETLKVNEWLIVGSPQLSSSATGQSLDDFVPGEGSLSLGNARATGRGSLAIGRGFLEASGTSSMALGGYAARASGYGSSVSGSFCYAWGSFSKARGYMTRAGGAYATAIGYRSSSYGRASVSLGGYATTQGDYSFSFGEHSSALGDNSFALGTRLTSYGTNTQVFGKFNDPELDPSIQQQDEPNLSGHLFVVGNGEQGNPSNALVLKDSGETSLSNKNWDSSNPTDEVSEDEHGNTGEALIVNGHTVLNGKVTLSEPQGDISMGIFQ